MTMKQCLSAALVAALVSGSLPAPARADESVQTTADRSVVDLHASIARAAANAAADQSKKPMQQPMFAATGQASTGGSGGGGGHTALIITLVTTAVGLGLTYYAVKQMEKTTNEIQTQATQAK